MNKTLTKSRSTVDIFLMSKQRTEAKMVMGKSAGFRPPNEEFCEKFNLAMEVTGWSLNDLCIAAIECGLEPAVAARIAIQREAAKQFSQAQTSPSKNKK